MGLTALQVHVLSNLDRVEPLAYKINTVGQRKRFVLDGKECTFQITCLVVRRLVKHMPGDTLVQLPTAVSQLKRIRHRADALGAST